LSGHCYEDRHKRRTRGSFVRRAKAQPIPQSRTWAIQCGAKREPAELESRKIEQEGLYALQDGITGTLSKKRTFTEILPFLCERYHCPSNPPNEPVIVIAAPVIGLTMPIAGLPIMEVQL